MVMIKMKKSVLSVLLFASIFAGKSFAASFDCSKAKSYAEKTICSDEKLSSDDDLLSKVYNLAKKVAHNKGGFNGLTRDLWNARERCSDYKCVSDWYDSAFVAYDSVIKTNATDDILNQLSQINDKTEEKESKKEERGIYHKNYECFDSRDGNLALVTDYGNRFTIITRRAEKFESGFVSVQPNGSIGGISKDATEYYLVEPGQIYSIQYQGYSIGATGCKPRKD